MSVKRFYECILLVRPDVSPSYASGIAKTVGEFIAKQGGRVCGAEYWGFRTLAYRVKKRGKAHYICLGIETADLKGLEKYLRFHPDLLRFACFRQEGGLHFPTPLFQSSLEDMVNVEDTSIGEKK